MSSIGQPRLPERILAAVKTALDERGFTFEGFRSPERGGGIIAIAINGEKTLAHLGRDQADAALRLASLATRPEGRS